MPGLGVTGNKGKGERVKGKGERGKKSITFYVKPGD